MSSGRNLKSCAFAGCCEAVDLIPMINALPYRKLVKLILGSLDVGIFDIAGIGIGIGIRAATGYGPTKPKT